MIIHLIFLNNYTLILGGNINKNYKMITEIKIKYNK